MTYYVIEITNYIEPVSGKMSKYAVTPKEDENQAAILFHDKISAARKDANTANSIVFVVSEYGVALEQFKERYVNPATLPPEPDESVEISEPEGE